MDFSALQGLLERARGRKVVCVGDVMLDRYVYGEVGRVSPEAPIPVLSRTHETAMPGAAANVARNVAALGLQAVCIGAVGADADAAALADQLSAEGVRPVFVTAPDRPTTAKTRFVAGGQQLLRLDDEVAAPIPAETDAALARAIAEHAQDVGAILLSDYAKGAVTPAVIAACHEAAARTGCPVVVDPKGRSFAKYGPADLIKPNAWELSTTADLPVGSDAEAATALEAALAACEARAILVTRAGDGMSLLPRGGLVRHAKAPPRKVFDVSGAGDTSLAALGASLAAEADLQTAMEFALLASGVVVGKAGTATVSPHELIEAELAQHLAPAEAKITALEDALQTLQSWRRAGLKVGFTNGCFDILHRGHVAYLAQARAWCDRLVVAVNTDASVRRLKGPERPVNDLESRALVLAGLASVDLVLAFDEPTPLALIEAIRPDVLVKGADYTVEAVVGADVVRSYGGEVKLAPLVEGYSTTAALARLRGRGAAA